METILKELNAVLGVIGSFVILENGTLGACVMPERWDAAAIALAARVASQTFQALELSGQRIADADLVYSNGRLQLKNLPGGILVILCARNINIPLLNLTANGVVKKLTNELRAEKPAPAESPKPAPGVAPAPPPAAPATPINVIEPSPLYLELEKEAQRLINAAASSQAQLCAMDPLALWVSCPQTRQFLAAPQKRQIDFLTRAEQGTLIVRVLTRLGYQANQRFNAFHGSRRLNLIEPTRLITVDLYLDAFEMYHKLDLTALLAQNAARLSETALVLMRLQLVEMNDQALSDLCALLLEHDLSVGAAPEKIDALQIARVCAEDWGWFKTVSLNLDRLTTFAEEKLPAARRDQVLERVHRLKSNLDATPKSLRWQTRARLGETVRWYDTPLAAQATGGRPDLSMS